MFPGHLIPLVYQDLLCALLSTGNEGPKVQTFPPQPHFFPTHLCPEPCCPGVWRIYTHGLPSSEKIWSFEKGPFEKAIGLHPNESNHRNVQCWRCKWGHIWRQNGPLKLHHPSGSVSYPHASSEEAISKSPRHRRSKFVLSLRAVLAPRASGNLSHSDCQKRQSELVKGE